MLDIHQCKFQHQYYKVNNLETTKNYNWRCNTYINYYQSQARTEITGKRVLSYIGPKVWRDILRDIKQASAQ